MAGTNSCRTVGYFRVACISSKNKPFLVADLAKDIARFNSNLSGIQLNAGTTLNCAMQSTTIKENVCANQLKQLTYVSQLTQKAVKPYLNMSNQAQFSLLLTPDFEHIENLPTLLKRCYPNMI